MFEMEEDVTLLIEKYNKKVKEDPKSLCTYPSHTPSSQTAAISMELHKIRGRSPGFKWQRLAHHLYSYACAP